MSVTMPNCSQVKTLVRTTSTQMNIPEMVSDSLCRHYLVVQTHSFPAVRMAHLRSSHRWRSRIWRSWAGLVTLGLLLWGRLDVLPNSLKRRYGREMNILLSGNSSGGHSCSQHANYMLPQTWDNCGIVLFDKTEWLIIVPSTRCNCVMIRLFNHLLDMPHLSGGWIILAKEKCSLTGMYANWCTKFERNKLFVCMEKWFYFSSWNMGLVLLWKEPIS
jgi:hypothetical protein